MIFTNDDSGSNMIKQVLPRLPKNIIDVSWEDVESNKESFYFSGHNKDPDPLHVCACNYRTGRAASSLWQARPHPQTSRPNLAATGRKDWRD